LEADTKKQNAALVLCDFDGTASAVDVGYRLLRHFSGDEWEFIDRKYRSDSMGSLEAYELIASVIHASEREFLNYLPGITKLTSGFKEFWAYCRSNGFDLNIVSDGLDFYIRHILTAHDIYDIPCFSNHLIFDDGRGIRIEFPRKNPVCGRCGTCKKTILENFRNDYRFIIYIGDGYSDRCAAENADLVFGKRVLYNHCLEKGIDCIHYRDFNDIVDYFEKNSLPLYKQAGVRRLKPEC
jgi:2-hydroxy-3-keto-5-methylthiopentenyl-1-phosphate phosphatase